MKHSPTTFSLVLGLVALALLLALGLASVFSIRARLQVIGDTYGRLIVATVVAVDELSSQHNPQATRTLAALERAGVRFARGAPPQSTTRIAPVTRQIGHSVGRLLGDPSRVVVAQAPESQIWIRSVHDQQRWTVLHTVSFRSALARASLLITLLAGTIALGAAAVAARVFTRPLERLSGSAVALLAGDPMQEQLRGSPREVHQLAAAIAAASERLRNAARERELMLAGISHDLRTPLARLRLALELGDADDPQRREAMVTDLQELDCALEQCLAFVRGGHDETRRETDIATLAGQLLALRQEPEDWRFDGPARLFAQVRPGLLRRAIGNLMDNADRYGTAPFGVTIGRDGSGVFVRITDSGPGVRPQLLERLGQPFLRGDPARSGGGSGLGLSIVMRAAELHGGQLDLRNGDQGGFVATLYLPTCAGAD